MSDDGFQLRTFALGVNWQVAQPLSKARAAELCSAACLLVEFKGYGSLFPLLPGHQHQTAQPGRE
jgi:hypothetical protein